jgi:hypothetical protein
MAIFRSTHAGADSAANNYELSEAEELFWQLAHVGDSVMSEIQSYLGDSRRVPHSDVALVRVIWESESRARAAQRRAFGEAKNQKCGAPFGPSSVKGNAFLRTRGSCSRKSHCTRTQCHVKQLVFTCAHCYKDALHCTPCSRRGSR